MAGMSRSDSRRECVEIWKNTQKLKKSKKARESGALVKVNTYIVVVSFHDLCKIIHSNINDRTQLLTRPQSSLMRKLEDAKGLGASQTQLASLLGHAVLFWHCLWYVTWRR